MNKLGDGGVKKKRTGSREGNVVADDERFDSLLKRIKLEVTRRTLFTYSMIQKNENIFLN